jgi:hypothetical protein
VGEDAATRGKMMTSSDTPPMPGDELQAGKLPGHWLLARLGKRVLRPGGRQIPDGQTVYELRVQCGLEIMRLPSFTAAEVRPLAALLAEHGP